MPAASPITCVQLTWTWPIVNPPLSVGRPSERDWPPLLVHSRSISPNRTSVSPSVATALTSGSRRASAGPNTMPYASVTAAATRTQTSHATHVGAPALVRDQAIRAPVAPTAPNARYTTPVARYRTTSPDPRQGIHPAQGEPAHDERLNSGQLGIGLRLCR